MMDMAEKKRILAAVCAAEREAAELLLHAHGVLAECKTGHRDVVTEYDRRVQELLLDRLSAACPGARFFCEENDRHDDLHAEHLRPLVQNSKSAKILFDGIRLLL